MSESHSGRGSGPDRDGHGARLDSQRRGRRRCQPHSLLTPFPRYWLSYFLSNFGDGVRLAAFPLLASHLTRSPTAVAAVTAMLGLPWLLLGSGAGIIVDRTDNRRLMVAVDAIRAVVIASLAVAVATNSADLVMLYLAAFFTGVGSSLRDNAATASVPRLVDSGDLERANGRLVAGQIIGYELVGPAAGSWMFGVVAVLPFAVNAGTMGIAALLLLTLPGVFQPASRANADQLAHAPAKPWRNDLREGFRWLRSHSNIRDVTVISGVVSLTDAGWFAVLVLYVIDVLHQRPGIYGLLLAIAALGGVLTGAFGPRLTMRLGPWPPLLLSGVAMAATQVGLGLNSNVAVAAGILFCSSSAFALFNMTAVTMLQRQVPAELLGRVISLYGTVTRGSEALGAVAGGILATSAGIRAPMLAGAAPTCAVVVLYAWRHRASREQDGRR